MLDTFSVHVTMHCTRADINACFTFLSSTFIWGLGMKLNPVFAGLIGVSLSECHIDEFAVFKNHSWPRAIYRIFWIKVQLPAK